MWFVVEQYKKAVEESFACECPLPLIDAHENFRKTAKQSLHALPYLAKDSNLWEIAEHQLHTAISIVYESFVSIEQLHRLLLFPKNEKSGIIEQTSIDAHTIEVDTSVDGFLWNCKKRVY